MSFLRKLRVRYGKWGADERGATGMEWTLVAAIVALVGIPTVTTIGAKLYITLTTIASRM